jgi:hypothetical protein
MAGVAADGDEGFFGLFDSVVAAFRSTGFARSGGPVMLAPALLAVVCPVPLTPLRQYRTGARALVATANRASALMPKPPAPSAKAAHKQN